ncbi:hypothetical protein [Streptomyces daliensis]
MAATLGRPVLAQLGDAATVYCDEEDLIFLVPYDTGGGFGAGTEYLSIGAWLFMPGPQRTQGPGVRGFRSGRPLLMTRPQRTQGPGVHWLSGNERTCTSPEALRAALDAVRQQAPEADR